MHLFQQSTSLGGEGDRTTQGIGFYKDKKKYNISSLYKGIDFDKNIRALFYKFSHHLKPLASTEASKEERVWKQQVVLLLTSCFSSAPARAWTSASSKAVPRMTLLREEREACTICTNRMALYLSSSTNDVTGDSSPISAGAEIFIWISCDPCMKINDWKINFDEIKKRKRCPSFISVWVNVNGRKWERSWKPLYH